MPLRALLPTSVCLLALAATVPLRAGQLTIYRCTDAGGKLTVRDSPCLHGERQQTQERIRPRDGKPLASPAPAPPAPRDSETVRYVVRPAHAPLHACITPDGRRYLSESPYGDAPRWTPVWVPARTVPDGRSGHRGRAVGAEIGGRTHLIGRLPDPATASPAPLPGMRHLHGLFAPVGGYWSYDACTPLTPEEACGEWSDRRHVISRRYYQAMPSERRAMDRESALLSRRIADACGNG